MGTGTVTIGTGAVFVALVETGWTGRYRWRCRGHWATGYLGDWKVTMGALGAVTVLAAVGYGACICLPVRDYRPREEVVLCRSNSWIVSPPRLSSFVIMFFDNLFVTLSDFL